MEKEISKSIQNKESIEKIYQQTLKKIDLLELDYFKKVERGKNQKALQYFNDMVLAELGINNFELLGYKPK